MFTDFVNNFLKKIFFVFVNVVEFHVLNGYYPLSQKKKKKIGNRQSLHLKDSIHLAIRIEISLIFRFVLI